MQKYSFILEGVTPSQNEWDKWHWSKRTELKDSFSWQIKRMGCGSHNGRMAHVHIVRVPKRVIDPLNVYSGCKGLLDAFVDHGYLRGDAAKDLTIQVDQRKREKDEEPHMEVTINYL